MKLATVERITSIDPIPEVDTLELATVLGWKVIVRKGIYTTDTLCIFIPIDTTIDPTRKYFKFMADKKHPTRRVKIETTKMRGIFSQGLIIPLSSLEGDLKEGDDVAAQLGVEKYEKGAIIHRPFINRQSFAEPFPEAIIAKTDEDNLRTRPHVLQEFIGEDSYITLKVDGSSLTIIYNTDGKFMVCSRRLVLAPDADMYKFVERIRLREKLEKYGRNIAIQGEYCGPKVNANRLGLSDFTFYVFNVKNLDNGKYMGCEELAECVAALGLTAVHLIRRLTITPDCTIDTLQEIANEVKYVLPADGREVPGEGIVIRPVTPKWSEALEKWLSVKVINQMYKD